jgi:hypothetical protein
MMAGDDRPGRPDIHPGPPNPRQENIQAWLSLAGTLIYRHSS